MSKEVEKLLDDLLEDLSVSKIKRNHPCPCGSGRKYKKCCLSKEEGARIMDEKPKNKFRAEVKKEQVSEREMLERDQRITYLRFKCQAEMLDADRLHTEGAIEKLKALGNDIFRLPDSEGRTVILEENKQHIEKLEKQVEAQSVGRAHRVILSLLEEKFGLDTDVDSVPEELKDE